MRSILILYATREGQTQAVCEHLARTLERRGHVVDLILGDDPDPLDLDFEAYDGVIVGASVHLGHHQGYLVDLVRRHKDEPAALAGAFFSVSLEAASPRPVDRDDAWVRVDRFCDETGWRPQVQAIVAGALRPDAYGPLERLLIRLTAGARGRESSERVYTDWAGVDRIADELLAVMDVRVDLVPPEESPDRASAAPSELS